MTQMSSIRLAPEPQSEFHLRVRLVLSVHVQTRFRQQFVFMRQYCTMSSDNFGVSRLSVRHWIVKAGEKFPESPNTANEESATQTL